MFIDLGCSTGGSLKFGENALKLGKGIGFDIDPKKVQAAKDAGLNVLLGDCTKLDEILSHQYDFALASHFLEHLPDLCTTKAVINSAIKVTSKAIFIKQPAFDGLDYFDSLGVKLYYSDWSGHKNMMPTESWNEIIEGLIAENKIKYAFMGYMKELKNTGDDAFIPKFSPRNQQRYNYKTHGEKPSYELNKTYYEEIRIVLAKNISISALRHHTKNFVTQDTVWFGVPSNQSPKF